MQWLVNAVLEEGGKFASKVIAPLNVVGDVQGCVLNKETQAATIAAVIAAVFTVGVMNASRFLFARGLTNSHVGFGVPPND